MGLRVDALVDAARMAVALDKLARDMGGLATVSQLSIPDSSGNVVPGEVVMTLDLRHEQDVALDSMERQLDIILSAVCGAHRKELEPVWKSSAVRFDETCLSAIRKGAEAACAIALEVVSGAGHDSVNVANVAPTAMIFVPCR